jgi:hypothetical protein
MSEAKQGLTREVNIKTKNPSKRVKWKNPKTVDKRSKHQNESIYQRKRGK